MQADYRAEILAHPLRREIVATRLANAVVNRGGPTFVTRIADRTGAAAAEIVAAYLVVRAAFDIEALNDAIDRLDGTIGGALQLDLYRGVQDLLIGETIWFLANSVPVGDLGSATAEYRRAVDELAERAGTLPDGIAEEVAGVAARYRDGGVPEPLAARLALLPVLRSATDIHLVASAAGTTTAVAAAVYFGVGVHLRLHRIEAMARAVPAGDYYQGLALDRTLQRLAEAQRRIAVKALGAAAGAASLGLWLAAHQEAVERVTQAVRMIVEGADPSLARVAVAAGLIADLARG
jgi:glutamate dehydrogenase